MKNKYSLFAVKCIVLLGLLVLVDWSFGFALEYFYPRMKSGESSRITYAIDKSNEKVMIFGSSKANHHYVPAVLEKGLNNTVYNAGIDGQSVFYHYAVLKCIQERYNPEIIVLDLHLDEFNKLEDSYTRLSALFPYYKRHAAVQPIVKMRGRYEKYKIISNLYRYNSLAITIAKNNVVPSKTDVTDRGYYPLYNALKHPLAEDVIKAGITIDTAKVKFFEKFIADATSGGSQVFVFISPMYRLRKDESETIRIAKEICQRNNVLLTDYSQDALFLQHPDYFQDASHLNNEGATVYSEMVVERITRKEK